ncbi:MAG: hypothetical protein ACFE75_11225 [Candidatus Hodarchaeota archaeon]
MMSFYIFLIITVSWVAILILSLISFARRVPRRVGRGFRRVSRRIRGGFRRVERKVGRGFRRVTRRVERRIERVTRRVGGYQRKFAITDPNIFNSIQSTTAKSMKDYLDKNEWIKEKDLKRKVKNEVALEIEKDVQESSMRDMRPLIDSTIDETINLTFLKEVKNRGDQLKIRKGSLIGKVFWRLIFPLAIAVFIGGISLIYPDILPPGNLFINGIQQPGMPVIIDPIQRVQSILINGAVYGTGTLLLVGIIILIRRK